MSETTQDEYVSESSNEERLKDEDAVVEQQVNDVEENGNGSHQQEIEAERSGEQNDSDENSDISTNTNPRIEESPVATEQRHSSVEGDSLQVPTSLDEQPQVSSKAVPASGKRKRLPQDIVGRLEDKLSEDPTDVDTWRSLIKEMRAKEKLEDLREVFERMLTIFPLSSETWISYIDTELANGEFQRVEQLFARCLNKVLAVGLWKFYVGYIRRMNNVTDGDKARNIISQVYEFVLSKIGIDKDSGPIWAEYLDFIKSKETTTTWEQQQKMDLLRKTYRRAICIPLNNLEALWQGYNAFETSLNKTTARKFLAEKSAIYMTARSCLKELQNLTVNLDRNTTPGPRKWSKYEQTQENIWKHVIEWEKKNPLEMEDKEAVQERIMYSYRQATMCLRYHPPIWFDAAEYFLSISKESDAMDLLTNAMIANPTSFLVFYKMAEIREQKGQVSEVSSIYNKIIDNLKELRAKELEKKPAEQVDATSDDNTELLKTELELNAKDITSAYATFMKAIKRLEGIKQARKIFGEGRKLDYVSFHIYTASAMMEFYNNKEAGIAGKIFEIGLKRYSENAEFVKEYFDFLILTNDDTNARALFEKSVTKMSPENAKPLYEHFLKYEAKYGELSALLKLEQRYKEIYSDESSIDLFSQRFQLEGFDPIADVDFGARIQRLRKGSKGTSVDNPEEIIDDEETPRKKQREESTAEPGLMFEQPHSTVPAGLISLLRALPPASSYDTVTFDPTKLVKLIREVNIPDSL